jgi:hypothetical protein
MSLMSFSQIDSISEFPKTVIINNEPYTIFRFDQAKQVAKLITERDFLFKEVRLYKEEVELLNLSIFNLKKQIQVKEDIILSKNLVIKAQKEIISDQESIIKDYQRKEKKRKIRNSLLVGASVAILTTLLIIK